MPSIIRKMPPMSGSLTAILISRNGFYAQGMPNGLPVSRRISAVAKELMLRLRLCVKGAYRGLVHASGIIGVGRLFATVLFCTCGHAEAHAGTICPAARIEHLGLLSTKVITNAGVTFLRDDWNNNGQDFTTMNFHACGTGVVAENVTDTGMGTEQTTNLNPASTRGAGTRSVPASNQYQTVGTLTFAGAAAVTEHGIMSASATGTGSLWDRSVFAAINVGTGDSIQFTYVCTLTAGG